MSIVSRISAYHRTRGGLLIFALTELLCSIIFFLAFLIDPSEMDWIALYVLAVALAFLFGFLQNITRFVIACIYHQQSAGRLPRKYRFTLAAAAIFLVVLPLLLAYFPIAKNLPAIVLPNEYPCSDNASPAASCMCLGLLLEDLNTQSLQQGFPFVTTKASATGAMCTPPPNTTAYNLDMVTAMLVAAAIGIGGIFGTRFTLERVRRG